MSTEVRIGKDGVLDLEEKIITSDVIDNEIIVFTEKGVWKIGIWPEAHAVRITSFESQK